MTIICFIKSSCAYILSSYYFLVIAQHQYNGVQLCLEFVFVLNCELALNSICHAEYKQWEHNFITLCFIKQFEERNARSCTKNVFSSYIDYIITEAAVRLQ